MLKAALIVLALATAAAADVLLVPSQYPTIKAAITAAANSDTVLIADGVYTGPGNVGLFFGGKAITVRSENGPGNCIIDAAHAAVIVTFNAGEGPGSVLQGLTLREGNGAQGGGVHCSGASPTIRDCFFDTGWAGYHGSGVGCINASSPRIEDCQFVNGLAGVGGAVYALSGSHPRLTGCTIRGHRTDLFGAGGAGCDAASALTIDRCVFMDNTAVGFSPYGGAILVGGTATITNSLFVNNSGFGSGGAIAGTSGSNITIINCTFSGNLSGGGGGAVWTQGALTIAGSILWANIPDELFAGDPTVRYSVVSGGWPGPGNLSVDPGFGAEYRLAPGSPCIDAGDGAALPAGLTLDLGGQVRRVDDPATPDTGVGPPPVIDIGAYEFQVAGCYPDCDGDGALTLADFGCFQTRFALADPYADCNGDQALNLADFGCFQTAFATGCP